MLVHGIENVRGGAYYSNIDLLPAQVDVLKTELNHATNKCLSCGSNDHYAKHCNEKSVFLQ